MYSIQRTMNPLVSDMLEINKEFLSPVMEGFCERSVVP